MKAPAYKVKYTHHEPSPDTQDADLLSIQKYTTYQLTYQEYILYAMLGKFVRFNQDKVIGWEVRKSDGGWLKKLINIYKI